MKLVSLYYSCELVLLLYQEGVIMRNAKVITLFTLVALTGSMVVTTAEAGSIVSWGQSHSIPKSWMQMISQPYPQEVDILLPSNPMVPSSVGVRIMMDRQHRPTAMIL